MKTQEARNLGIQIGALVQEGKPVEAYELLRPILGQRTPFRLLMEIAAPIGAAKPAQADDLLGMIAGDKTEGGWVIIGGILGQWLERNRAGAFARCRNYVIQGDTWFAADILGERVPGPALVASFQPALRLLKPWRDDDNHWVRRAVGVAAHFWAKRTRGERPEQAIEMLALLRPLFGEWDMDAVKGIGWGLKTLGRHYPDQVAQWLAGVLPARPRYRALMLRKVLTYLPREQRDAITGRRTKEES